ncbi:MAG: AAA family ATPase [Deltaproteobacteria bacterium]|nr:AAA family ATPase [Deltaproteobacteria bacterium]
MYQEFFGFKQKPFQLLPDPDFLFHSKKHDAALTHLEYGIFDRAGFIVITGDIGTGKTTLIRYILRSLSRDLPLACLSQTLLSPEEFLRAVCQEFSLPHDGRGKPELIRVLKSFLLELCRKRRYAILILDEAQNLPVDTLEEIRMLSNFDGRNEFLLQIIFVGQPSLRGKLRWRGLRQLSQRIQVSYHLEPLDREELEDYIKYRLHKAGAPDLELFNEETFQLIYDYSGGVPRLINAVCHMCLVYAMADDLKKIDIDLAKKVLEDRANWDVPLDEEAADEAAAAELLPVATDNLGSLQSLGHLEANIGELLEVSLGAKNALERIALSLGRIAASKQAVQEMAVRLMAEKSRRQTLEKNLARIEKKLDAAVVKQKLLIKVLTGKNKQRASPQPQSRQQVM